MRHVFLVFTCLLMVGCDDSSSTHTNNINNINNLNNAANVNNLNNADCVPRPTGGFHVAVDGTPGGDGSIHAPWDLATALAQPPALVPGSTIWIHGGVYAGAFTSMLTGEDGNPLFVRVWPGETAVIDGASSEADTLTIEGAWTEYHGLEITNSNPARTGARPGTFVNGANLSIVNCRIHDTGGGGYWAGATDMLLYGSLIYNNGYDDDDRAHGHGVYSQNLEGTKLIEDNIIFSNYSFGIHIYTEGGDIQGYEIAGNIWFLSGRAAAGTGTLKDNCLIGGLQPASRIILRENLGWAPGPSHRGVQFGYSYDPNGDLTLTDNYLSGVTNFSRPWSSLSMTGNTFLGDVNGIELADFPGNTHVTEQPTENRVFIRPNNHEAGRAHVAVYNWTFAPTQSVDLSSVLADGDTYEIRDAQNWDAGPVVSGTFDGAPITLPMEGLVPAQPVGVPDAIDTTEMTGHFFNAFVVRRTVNWCP
ncbi:MAG: hypothetical protein CVU59_07115 [Deltaproteobacteria bacterium HGW-Deltaproteobacteria-17]|nr:MAG: hypothetical protein CVU59_07115 [Deltaproteobacteria bacterium HGW-Deltaproteobacteria-17]